MKLKNLTDIFDAVYVINCAHRPDRLERVSNHLVEQGLVDIEKVTFYPAVIGDWVTCPSDWKTGNGAWGCFRSHQRIMEDVMHQRDERLQLVIKKLLILEDDVFFLENALENINRFMEVVPDDWGQIYLGGQHQVKPEPTKVEGVIVGRSVNRTHAYAIHERHIHRVYRHICYATDYRGTYKHIDHQLELAHQRRDWPVYCPEKWFCGQEAGSSNVSGKTLDRMTWQH